MRAPAGFPSGSVFLLFRCRAAVRHCSLCPLRRWALLSPRLPPDAQMTFSRKQVMETEKKYDLFGQRVSQVGQTWPHILSVRCYLSKYSVFHSDYHDNKHIINPLWFLIVFFLFVGSVSVFVQYFAFWYKRCVRETWRWAFLTKISSDTKKLHQNRWFSIVGIAFYTFPMYNV